MARLTRLCSLGRHALQGRGARVWAGALILGTTASVGGACSPADVARTSIPKEPSAPLTKKDVQQMSAEPRKVAVDKSGTPTQPRILPGAPGGVTSNDWWSSLIYPQDPQSVESMPLYAHPLVFRTRPTGIGVSYPNQPTVKEREYMYRYDEDFVVGFSETRFDRLTVLDHSDFSVRFSLAAESGTLDARIGHGIPYLQLTSTSERSLRLQFQKAVRISSLGGGTAVFSVADRTYVAFASEGDWIQRGKNLLLPAGDVHVAIAALPTGGTKNRQLLERHAFRFIDKTSVEWKVDGNHVETFFGVQTTSVVPCEDDEVSCPDADETLLALYPHQWSRTEQRFVGDRVYSSPRGPMRLVRGNGFSTKARAQAILPMLPIPQRDRGRLRALLALEVRDELFPVGQGENPAHDAYWDGKSLGRVATLLHLAHALNEEEIQQRLLTALEARLADWFDGQAPRYFYYDRTWRSLIAFPASYGSASHLNDHHFHYGYFVYAAAAVARFDRDWARRYEPMVELLIRDVAAWDANDPRFPRLRHMDPYAGHSWANGPSQFFEGNNEESSSEDIAFSAATALWGALTNDTTIEELGLYLFATQVSAVYEYWFDVHDRVFPEGFEHPTVAMVWGAGAKYDTWFDQDPGIIHGINFLPVTGSSLYLGRYPRYAKKNFDTIVERSHGEITTWRDYLLMFAALFDPEQALSRYREDPLFEPEFGASRTMTESWLLSLHDYGLPDFSRDYESPYAIDLVSDGRRTTVRFDPSSGALRSSSDD